MYAKVFVQIFDSSIADDFRLRHFFMDMLVLADKNGVVDMTPRAIAARTRIPLEDVESMLDTLEQPDTESRTPDADGRRIERLDEHRSWGWHIINYSRFRDIASEEQRREKTRDRVARFKQKRQQNATGNAPLTLANASNAMQRHMQKQLKPTPTSGQPSIEQVREWAIEDKVEANEAERFFNHFESTGWVDKHGNAIVNARAKLRIWASDKRGGASEKAHHAKATDAEPTFWQLSKRFDQVDSEIKAILNRASQTATGYIIQPKDKEPLKRLRADRKELKAKLGLT